MCGRFVLILSEDGVGELIRERDIPAEVLRRLIEEGRAQMAGPVRSLPNLAFASYNIAPTHQAPIVVNRDGHRQIELARWSYVPPYWKEEKPPKFATFNARDDKLKSSGVWRSAIDGHRCMVPATGFYEWEKRGKERLPYFIHRKEGQLMAFAGLYSMRTNPETGQTQTSFTIITTPTNSFMEKLHDRIPLVFGGIEDELWSLWLDPQTKFERVERHVASREWPEMAMHRVSTDVNTTGKAKYVNEPRLIDPVEPEPEQGGLF